MGEKQLSFTFEKCLGMGGFGEVYVATMRQPGGPGRRVAVKVLKRDLQNTPEAVQRLRDEGRMLGVLNHPSIVRGLEMTVIAGRVALVTEYHEGLDVARCCKPSTQLPPKIVLSVISEVASALDCAYSTLSPETGKPLRLIHRDIKPDNIRIGSFGAVKVLDFGIARTTEMFRHAKTVQGALPFTPGYAPPEAFTKGFQGASSDVFALGVTLYRLLVAKKFFEGLDLSGQVSICCLAERYDPFLEQRLRDLEIEGPIKQLVHDMLRYVPEERPSAAEVAARCEELASSLEGPDLVTWARAMTFPPPKVYEGASLTGMTLREDRFDGKRQRRNNPREEHRRRMGRKDALPVERSPPVKEQEVPSLAPLKSVAPAKVTLDIFMVEAGPPEVPGSLGARSLTPAPVPEKRALPLQKPIEPVPDASPSLMPMVLLGGLGLIGLLFLVLVGIGLAIVMMVL